MSWSDEFVALDKTLHDRASFDCGEPAINTFIQTKAAKHMKAGISRTMVLPAFTPGSNGKYAICVFYTIAPSSIRRKILPEKLAKKLPYYPVPVFLIGQIGVLRHYQGQGLGKITLIKALEYLWEINQRMSAYAVIVDCLNKETERFYWKYGFDKLFEAENKTRMYIPMKTIAKLFI
jgi:GNAT superfamily N-acetyltransferase